jgi:hypothetical protein
MQRPSLAGQSESAKQFDRPEAQLAVEALVAALADVGLKPGDADVLCPSAFGRRALRRVSDTA